MSKKSLDEILGRLVEAAEESQSENNEPIDNGSRSDVTSDTAIIDDGQQINAHELRNWLAVENAYQQWIPPMTPAVIKDLDEFISELPMLLKGVDRRPYLKEQILQAKRKNMTDNSRDRNVVEDTHKFLFEPDIQHLASNILNSGNTNSNDRVVFAAGVFSAVVAGIAVGRAIARL